MSGERMTAADEAYFRRILDAGLDLGRAQASQVFRELDAVRKELAEARGQLINARLCFDEVVRERDEARELCGELDIENSVLQRVLDDTYRTTEGLEP